MKQLIKKLRKKFSNYLIKKMIKREGFDPAKMYHIEVCRGAKRCSRNVINVNQAKESLIDVLETNKIAAKLHKKLAAEEIILPHHMFKLAISGCVNGCAKPQIKDFGIVGQLKPKTDQTTCIGCHKCVNTCSENAISLDEQNPKIDFDKCIFCGDCLQVCPNSAITKDKIGYQIQVGGHLGRHPRLASIVTNLSNLETVNHYLNKSVEIFIEKGEGQQRLGTSLDELDMTLK